LAQRRTRSYFNKTRLKIHHGDIDFDLEDSPILISNDAAGVDAEDANVSCPSFLFSRA